MMWIYVIIIIVIVAAVAWMLMNKKGDGSGPANGGDDSPITPTAQKNGEQSIDQNNQPNQPTV